MTEEQTTNETTPVSPEAPAEGVADRTKGNLMDVGPGCLAVPMINGHLDAQKALHNVLVVKEMTGYEEDILGGKGPILARLTQIVTNCTVRIGNVEDRKEIGRAVSTMSANDRLLALIAIRRISLGDFYDIYVDCPNPPCKERTRFSINLAEIEMQAMPDPLRRTRTDMLSTGRTVQWHIMTAEDEGWLVQRQRKREDVFTLAMLARVDAIDDTPLQRAAQQAAAVARLKALSTRERNEIRQLFEREEGTIDTEVDFQCTSCQHAWKAELDIARADFFFPSAT